MSEMTREKLETIVSDRTLSMIDESEVMDAVDAYTAQKDKTIATLEQKVNMLTDMDIIRMKENAELRVKIDTLKKALGSFQLQSRFQTVADLMAAYDKQESVIARLKQPITGEMVRKAIPIADDYADIQHYKYHELRAWQECYYNTIAAELNKRGIK